MAYLTESLLMNPSVSQNSHHLLAAFAAGALFLMEGALLGILVLAAAKTARRTRAP